MRVLTEEMLRSAKPWGSKELEIDPDTYVTAEARRFAEEQRITLRPVQWETMSRVPVDTGAERPYVDAVTGAGYACKPEDMTHLHANALVKKTHPRIAFRGQLDRLEAEIISQQVTAAEGGRRDLCQTLGELLDFVRGILAAEVKEQPLPPVRLLGYDAEGLRTASHQVEKSVGIPHPVPDWRMGRYCAMLNLLRTRVRETELCAAAAFAGQNGGADLILALNRLSSAVYLLFCKEVKRHG